MKFFIPNAPFLISTFSRFLVLQQEIFQLFPYSLLSRTLEKSFMCTLDSWKDGENFSCACITKCHLIRFYTSSNQLHLAHFIDPWFASFDFFPLIYSALSSNAGVLTINIDKLSVKEAIHNINYVRALCGLDHVGLGPTTSPRKYALLLAELARDRLWNNASLKKLVGGNIVRILREVSRLVWIHWNFHLFFHPSGWSE